MRTTKQIKPSRVATEACRHISMLVSRVCWRIEFHDTENIPLPDSKGLIVVSNHQTFFDPFWISIPIKRNLRYLAWDRPLRWPLFGWTLRKLGALPINLEQGGTLSTLRLALRLLKEGESILVFPEGSRELADGKLLPIKSGAAQMAIRTSSNILPVTISGGNQVWPRDRRLPRFGKIHVSYHPVIRLDQNPDMRGAESINGQIEKIFTTSA